MTKTSGHQMAAEGKPFPWRLNRSMISANLELIWEKFGNMASTPKKGTSVSDKLVKVYETGGIPLTLIVVGVFMSLESNVNWIDDEPTGIGDQLLLLSGVGLMLAGAACWMLDVYLRRQRENALIDLLAVYIDRDPEGKILTVFGQAVNSILRGAQPPDKTTSTDS